MDESLVNKVIVCDQETIAIIVRQFQFNWWWVVGWGERRGEFHLKVAVIREVPSNVGCCSFSHILVTKET